jgi:2-dehydropantoate 2-reductase
MLDAGNTGNVNIQSLAQVPPDRGSPEEAAKDLRALLFSPADAGPLARLVQALQAAGMETETMPDIGRLVWRKMAASCSINPVAALLGVANGVLVSSADGRERLAAAAREVGAVAAAKGIDLQEDAVALALTVAARTAGNRCSMLQDLDRGAPTEIDALCGAVVAEGRNVGVPTPVNHTLDGLARLVSSGFERR